MKLRISSLTVAALALGLAACGPKADKTVDTASNDTAAAAADVGNAASNAVNATVDAVTPTPTGQEFTDKAAKSDAFEIAAAKLALADGDSAKVKSFAREMIKAHTASTVMIKAAAKKATPAITPDPTLTGDQNDGLADLGKLKGAEFDSKYTSGQVDAHQDALSLMQDYAKNGDVPSLKATAGEIEPIVQKHLDMAKALEH